MATKYSNVIIFGPTGDVGSHAALEASARGAKVWLAMRNTSKAIPGLTSDIESAGAFERIQADLTDPASITAAVKRSGAKAAYIYLVHGPGGLSPSLAAMKDAGVEYVVFLSSFSVPYGADAAGIRSIPAERFISKAHADVEIALEDLGLPHAALRPAYFASNPFKTLLDKSKQPFEADIRNGDYLVDCIATDDIGRVGGALLVERPTAKEDANGKSVFYLCGPKLMSQDRMLEVIQEVAGVEIKVNHLDQDEWTKRAVAKGMPPPVAAYLAKAYEVGFTDDQYNQEMYTQAVKNVEEVTGRKPLSFEEFIKLHEKELLAKDA